MKKSISIMKGLILPLFAMIVVAACSKMDDTYKEFLSGGQIIYAGKAENAIIQPGRSRMVLAWPIPSDPKVVKARIIWNNGTDSLDIPITREEGQDSIKVPFDDLAEGPYTFEIYTFDTEGNRSVKVEVRGRVYGTTYEQTLLSRPIDVAELYEDTLKIEWGAAPDTTAIGSEIVYEDKDGKEVTLFVPAKTLNTNVLDFPVQETIKHRTLYLPTRFAIDTFYTAYATKKVKGPPIEFSKTGWIATTSSFDNRSGASYRPGSNAIDGNPSTIWVNQINPQELYPHTITVDMGSVKTDIEGFAIITRVGDAAARPKTVELLLSEDNVSWVSFGDVDLADTGDKQFIKIAQISTARYFKIIAKSPQKSAEKNIALAEVGLYTR